MSARKASASRTASAVRTETARLGEVGLLAGMSEEEIARILALGSRRVIGAGETFMREGEEGDSMFILVSGTVDVTKNLTLKLGSREFARAEKSMNKISAEHAPVFGEMALFGSAPRSATITAAGDCVAYEIGKADFEALCAGDPRLALALARRVAGVLSGRVRRGNEEVLKLSTALSIALSR